MAESYLSSKLNRLTLRQNMSNNNEPEIDDEDEEGLEEEYDALNDETFGLDSSGGGLEDWEEEHEQFAMLADTHGNGRISNSEMVDNLSHGNLQRTTENQQRNDILNKYNEEEDNTNIEDSLNQLVRDDDVEDPAIVGIFSKSNTAFKLKETRAYNISPPPPAIVESDHVGSPSTSIWSTPKGDVNKGFSNTLFKAFQHDSPISFDLQLMDPYATNAISDERKPNTQVKTLEEIENDILNSENLTKFMKQVDKREMPRKQRILTVGELEQNLSFSVADIKTLMKKPIGPPPGFTNKATLSRKSEQPTSFSPNAPRIINPTIGLSGSPSHVSQSMSPTSPLINAKSSPLTHPIQFQPLRPNLIIPPQLAHPAAFRAAPFLGQYAAGHPLMVGQVPYRTPYNTLPLVLGYQDKRDVISNYSRLQSNIHPNHRANLKTLTSSHNGWNSMRDNNMPDVDEYANLMSKKEKDWLVNIQMIQLQSDNPYLDDYYYTNFMLKKRVKETKEKEPTLAIPERSKVIESKTYKPVQYEGSLGKLQAGSVTCPRKMIDVHTVHVDDTEPDTQKLASRETKKLKQLLLDIEKLFALVLQADDIDKRVVILPAEAQLPLFEIKKEVISKLHNGFMQNGGSFFIHMIAIRKGRNLVARCMPLFSKEQLMLLLTLIFSNFSTVLKRDASEQLCHAIYGSFSSLLSTCGLETLTNFGERLCEERDESSGKSHCHFALEHKLGIVFVCDMISRAEELYRHDSLNKDTQLKWEGVISSIYRTLDSVTLPSTITCIPKATFVEHLQRFHHSRAVITSIQDWINRGKLLSRNPVT